MTAGTDRWQERRPFCWAHQGGAREGPSNTLHAMRSALAHGADGLGLNVHRTSDSALVVCHDTTLDRTTSGHGRIADQSLARVRAADSAYWWVPGEIAEHDPDTSPDRYALRGRGPFDPEFRVPTLAEVMKAFPDTPLKLDLKGDHFEAQVARELTDAGREDVIVVSRRERRLRNFRVAAPTIDTAAGAWFLVTFWLLSRICVARRPGTGVTALEVPDRLGPFTVCDRRLLKAAHRRALIVLVRAVDEEPRMHRLLKLEVDGLVTDRPSVLGRLTGKAGRGICELADPPRQVPATAIEVSELRIHGVGGSPGPRLLGFDDPREAPVCPELSQGAITIRTARGPHGTVTGFDWGDLTSGAKAQALWAFLLPFTLLNAAGWAHTSGGARLGPMWRALTRSIVVVAGWLLTATWVLWIADLLVGYVGYQWVPRVAGQHSRVVPLLPGGRWSVTLTPLDVRRLAVGAAGALVLGLFGLAGAVAGRASTAIEEPAQRHSSAFARADDPFDHSFFAKRSSRFASLLAHGGIALAVVVVVVAQTFVALGRSSPPRVAPIDRTIVLVAGTNLALLALLGLCSWLLPWLFSLGRRPPPGVRRANGTAVAAAVLATALTNAFFSGAVLWAVRYLGHHPRGATSLVTGRDLVLLDAYFFVAVAWAVIGAGLWMFRRKITRPLRTCGCDEEVPAPWKQRVAGAQASAAVIHKGDLLAVALAGVFFAVGVVFGLLRLQPVGWQIWRWDVEKKTTAGITYTAAAWALPWAAGFTVLRVRAAAKDNKVRRFMGQAWDVLSFWPRRYHPLAVRPYTHVAVPALRREINRLTAHGGRLVISAHSQGSVLAVAALATVGPSVRSRIALVTYGSHVPGLYRRAFPQYFDAATVAGVAEGLGGSNVPRWHNFYRLTDPIGGPMFDQAPVGARGYDYCLPDPAVQRARSRTIDSSPPREYDREPFVALAVHSYYLNEQRLKEVVIRVKEELAGTGT